MKEISKTYNPFEVEDKIYRRWEASGFFNPDKLPSAKKRGVKKFVVPFAPPNVTGSLHMGHALETTLVDIVVRRKRMDGYKTLWLVGTDHAGIATQNVVEKELRKEGKTRFDLGREKFIERIWDWRKKYGDIILQQLKKLGCSLDWSRIRFTLDKDYAEAVKHAFEHYYKKGWIYQGERVINWCPRCQTSISDLELEHQEEKGHLWHIKYPLKKEGWGGGEKFIVVATTRPETMLGDAAVAINPRDKRYTSFIGQKIILPIQNREIPIIADKAVDPKFGTGAVKVTPAHDILDGEIGFRHKLPVIKVIDEKGKMTKKTRLYEGLSSLECREKVIQELKNQNLLVKTEDYQHSLPRCERCHTLIQPLSSRQWFLKMEELAHQALEAVKKGEVRFIPKNFEKLYRDWLENIRDWCISRQLWWGHRIPIKGETDVLDTWFSSALWPFAILGWPHQTKDLKTFYPANFISSGREIINLWISRMIFSGLEFMGKVPFSYYFIHPTILTKEGKRMSKSLGTGLDPISLIEKYGADALRFGLAWQTTGLQDIRFIEDNIVMGKKFCNKIWNASRFVLFQMTNTKHQVLNRAQIQKLKKLATADRRILNALDKTTRSVNIDLDNFHFGQAAQKLYDFFWHDFCDRYLEESKKQNNKQTQQILFYVLLNSLKLLHPFMPFITEELWGILKDGKSNKDLLMTSDWPKADHKLINAKAEKEIKKLKETIAQARQLKIEGKLAKIKTILKKKGLPGWQKEIIAKLV